MKKFKFLMVAAITTILVTSCGSDSGGGSNVYNSGWGTSGGVGSGATGMSASGQKLYDDLLASFSCQQGQTVSYYNSQYVVGQRRQSAVVAHIKHNSSSYYNNSTVSGYLQEGTLPSESDQHYVGVNGQGDFVIVTKVLNGSTVMGYNVRLALCSRHFTFQNYSYPLISDDRGIYGVYLNGSGMTLDTPVNCAGSTVDKAVFSIASAEYNYSQPYNGVLEANTSSPLQVTFSTPCP